MNTFVVFWFEFALFWSPTYQYDFFTHITYRSITYIVVIFFFTKYSGTPVYIEGVLTISYVIALHQPRVVRQGPWQIHPCMPIVKASVKPFPIDFCHYCTLHIAENHINRLFNKQNWKKPYDKVLNYLSGNIMHDLLIMCNFWWVSERYWGCVG